MTKFVVIIHGVNFLLEGDLVPEPGLHGFYVNAYVEAKTSHDAETAAIELVRACTRLRGAVRNAADDPPRMFIEEIAVLEGWPEGCVRPLSGFAFYADSDAEWRNEHPEC